jgi:hypothetical protein
MYMAKQDYSFKSTVSMIAVMWQHFSRRTILLPQRGSWGISGIVGFGTGPNYVFFVSFGQTQADHEFDEAVYRPGWFAGSLSRHKTSSRQ